MCFGFVYFFIQSLMDFLKRVLWFCFVFFLQTKQTSKEKIILFRNIKNCILSTNSLITHEKLCQTRVAFANYGKRDSKLVASYPKREYRFRGFISFVKVFRLETRILAHFYFPILFFLFCWYIKMMRCFRLQFYSLWIFYRVRDQVLRRAELRGLSARRAKTWSKVVCFRE